MTLLHTVLDGQWQTLTFTPKAATETRTPAGKLVAKKQAPGFQLEGAVVPVHASVMDRTATSGEVKKQHDAVYVRLSIIADAGRSAAELAIGTTVQDSEGVVREVVQREVWQRLDLLLLWCDVVTR